jgi:TolA-binding protein
MVMEAFAELGDDASVDQVMRYLEAKKALESVKSGGESAEDVAMSDAEPVTTEEGEAMPEADRLSEILGALGVATVDEALELIGRMMGGEVEAAKQEDMRMSKTLRDQVVALTSRIEQLESERERLELDKLRAEVESVVDRLPQVHADRGQTVEHYVSLARQWPEGWRAQRDAAEARGPQPPRRQLGRAPATPAAPAADKNDPLYRSLEKAYKFVSDADKRHKMILSAMSAAEGGGE